MGSVNRVILIGNLGSDPEIKYLDGDKKVCNFRLACNETWKDKNGQRQERVEWVRVNVWGASAEHCAKYLKKGSQCYVEGRLQTRSWEKNGEKRYSTEVVSDRVVFLGGKPAATPASEPDHDPNIPF